MNQFRDLTIIAMITLAIALQVGSPENWGWIHYFGGYAEEGLGYLIAARPFDVVILFALALALFMTRLKY